MPAFAVILTLSSLSFLAILLALIRLLGMVALQSAIALLVASLFGRWRFVEPDEYRPAPDL